MSEGKMELRELSDGRVLRFEPATGRTWELSSWSRWELIDEPEDDEEEEDGDGPPLMRFERVPGTDLMVPPATMAVLAPLLGGTRERCSVVYPSEEDEADEIVGSDFIRRAYLDPDVPKPDAPWRELLGMGAAKETTPGYFQQTQAAIVETLNQALQDGELLGDYPDAVKLRLTLDTTEWDASLAKLGESLRRATDKTQVGEGESDEKPESELDYRRDAAWE